VIIGGGFAGVWSAAAAARLRHEAGVAAGDIPIKLVAPGHDMVIRPRLYEDRPEEMRVALDRILGPIGVQHVLGSVEDVAPAAKQVTIEPPTGSGYQESYDRLVIANGSKVVRPGLPGTEHLFDVDTLPAASDLARHLAGIAARAPIAGAYTVVVVGAGFTGLEVATEMVTRVRNLAAAADAESDVRIVLVERAEVVGPELGTGPRPVIEQALRDLGIELRLGTTVVELDEHSVTFSDGVTIPALTTVWTAGMRAGALTRRVPAARDHLDRLEVDSNLRVPGLSGVFAAGDAAAVSVDGEHTATQSCQHAHAMGKHAGHNAMAELLGLPLIDFAPVPYVTCLDLGRAGAVFTTGWERTVELSGQAAKDVKRDVNQVLIYPPTDDAEKIFLAVDHLSEVQRSDAVFPPGAAEQRVPRAGSMPT